jgi:Na+-driven multidrug efflux pump
MVQGKLDGPDPLHTRFHVQSDIVAFSYCHYIEHSLKTGPFVGQNLGAARYDLVKLGVKYNNGFSLIWGVVMFALLALTARPVASIFNDDPVVISIIT